MFDYSIFLNESTDSYETVWNNSLTYPENIIELIKNSILLPNSKIQIPIIASYILIPSAMAKILPILFCYGSEGTGKTNICKIAKFIHGVDIEGSTTTFAGLRNILKERKYYDNDMSKERNAILIFDDIDEKIFVENPNIYRMLKCSYDRESDTIEISSGTTGTNEKFRTFSTKIIGSYAPLHTLPSLAELHRRMIVIKCKKDFLFNRDELVESLSYQQPGFDYDNPGFNRLDIDSLNFTGLSVKYRNFWEDFDRCCKYASIRKKLVNKRSKPDSIKSYQWIISIDILSTGIASGIWDFASGIEHLEAYWQWINNYKDQDVSATFKLLKDFIAIETENITKINNELGFDAVPIRIEPKKIKQFLDKCSHDGKLDITPKIQTVLDVMRQLGWRLDKDWWVLIK